MELKRDTATQVKVSGIERRNSKRRLHEDGDDQME